jgi:flagellar biosynthesis regulator FlbT
MEKQTAVEYFNQEIKELFNMHQNGEISGKMFVISRLVALTKAKQMEREQIEEAYKADLHPCSDEDAEQYYNETYSK